MPTAPLILNPNKRISNFKTKNIRVLKPTFKSEHLEDMLQKYVVEPCMIEPTKETGPIITRSPSKIF